MKLAQLDRESIERTRAMMERQLGHMVRLVDDLLDLSRISGGKIELRKERIDLASVVQQAIETGRPAIDEAHHDLTVALPRRPIHVDADPTRLGQVLSNLLSNAAKFTERGGRIRLEVERQNDRALVSVTDSGIGIAEHKLDEVFEMFTQIDPSLERSQSGLGIGLAIVKRLVEMHGGAIEATSAGAGKGSRFTVSLPIASSVEECDENRDSEQAPQTPRCRILVADDNHDAAVSLSMILELLGNEVRTAGDGAEAVQVADVFRPDLILLDIGMPKLTGYEACQQIRQQPWSQDVVLVALTGWGQDDDRRRSQDSGFDFHLVKPIDPAAIEHLIADVAARR